MARVLALVGEMDGPALWRVLLPYSELQRQGFPGVEWGMRDDDRLAAVVDKFQAVVLPRLHWPPKETEKQKRWFAALHKAGIAVIYEMDDDLVSDDFVRRIMFKDGYGKAYAKARRRWILNAINACDGVTVSSQRLATMVREITSKPVVVVPNYIDLRWWGKVQEASERKVPGLTIGWAGGNRPDSDVEMMAEAWARIAARFPQVTFVVQGHHAPAIYNRVPNERIAMLDWMPIDSYPAGLVNIDIGCCPLADSKFNRAKTFIKAMEYAASGAAVVASPTVYGQIIDHSVNGYVCNTVDEWEAALAALVESEDLRKRTAAALLAKVTEHHSLEGNAWRWIAAWDDIIADFRAKRLNHILLPHEVRHAEIQPTRTN